MVGVLFLGNSRIVSLATRILILLSNIYPIQVVVLRISLNSLGTTLSYTHPAKSYYNNNTIIILYNKPITELQHLISHRSCPHATVGILKFHFIFSRLQNSKLHNRLHTKPTLMSATRQEVSNRHKPPPPPPVRERVPFRDATLPERVTRRGYASPTHAMLRPSLRWWCERKVCPLRRDCDTNWLAPHVRPRLPPHLSMNTC